jgi:hypothetical protein
MVMTTTTILELGAAVHDGDDVKNGGLMVFGLWSLVFGPWSYVANDVGIVGEGDTNEIID